MRYTEKEQSKRNDIHQTRDDRKQSSGCFFSMIKKRLQKDCVGYCMHCMHEKHPSSLKVLKQATPSSCQVLHEF